MPRRSAYANHCGLAAALELIGDRWTMLVLRDLVLGPRRFAQLQHHLRTIAPDVLTNRLRSLTEAGLVAHSGSDYTLTPEGQGLLPAMRELARWGGPHLPDPPVEGTLSAYGVLTSLVLAAGGPTDGTTRTMRFDVDGEVATITMSPDGNRPDPGAAATDHWAGTATDLLALLTSRRQPDGAIERAMHGLLLAPTGR